MKNEIQPTAASTATYSVDPRNIIVEEGFNVRIDYGDIKGLAQSIDESGVKIPLRVYRSKEEKEKFVLVDGHRRLRAAMMLINEGIEIKVPVILEGKHYSAEERILDMWRCNDGKGLTVIEKAEIVKRMNEKMWDDKKIAEKLGVSIQTIKTALILGNAPQKAKIAIQNSDISPTQFAKVVRECKGDEKLVMKTIDALLESAPAETNGKKKKVTAKALSSSENKVNSISEFRKFDKSCKKEGSVIIPEMIDTYEILEKMLEGKLTRKNFEKLFISKNPK